MLVQVNKLCYWKTEHRDLSGCQDACDFDTQRGVFAVADGAGTTLFPAIWARILVKHFVNIPLMNDDVFEVEWWVRLAQDKYKDEVPNGEKLLDWSVRQKAHSQGSDSTLATVRISAVTPSSACAELLVFGDSCVIIGDTQSKQIKSFVLQNEAEFNQAPICVPSTLKFFNRNFHRCSIKSEELQSHHIVALITDAVAKWILGHDRAGQWDAFEKVCNQSEQSWPAFIDDCRKCQRMIDDDATALILKFQEDSTGESDPSWRTLHHHAIERDGNVIQERKKAFEKAQQDENNELVAIYYGNGIDLQSVGISLSDEKKKQAQAIADAMKEVMRAFRQAQNSFGLAAKVEPVWRLYGHLLQNEKCAATLCETLQRNGVNLALPGQLHPSLPANPMVVQPAERVSTETADQLELQFSRACHVNHDDNAILETSEAMDAARSYYPHLRSFTEEEQNYINQARERKKARKYLQDALRTGSLEQVEVAHNSQLIDDTLLTPDERRRVELACSLMEAYREEKDEAFMRIFQTVSPTDYQTFFVSQDWEIINTVRQRSYALMKFRADLASRRLQQIHNAYASIQNDSKHLTERERELVALAQEFVQAYYADDDAAIVTAENKITNSPSKESIAFTHQECERIKCAEKRIEASNTVVVKVKGWEITIAMIKKVCKVREPYIHYYIDFLQQEINKAAAPSDKEKIYDQISIWQSEIDPQQQPRYALEDIIDNFFIEKEITEKQQQSIVFDALDVQPSLNVVKRYAVPDYETLLQTNRLTEKDVEEVLLLFLRRNLLSNYLQSQQKLARPKFPFGIGQEDNVLEKWLERQRKDAKVTYIQYGSDRRQRGLWLSKLLEQATS